jgi:hypothetical protein
VPSHRMGTGHVPAPEEPSLLSDWESYVLGGLLAMASGFVLVGGGGLIALWMVFGDLVWQVLHLW